MSNGRGITVLTPSPEALGSRFSSGTSTSSMRIIPVVEALRENFPSILGVERPFIPRSKMNPRTRPSSHLAHTIAISATGELVILKGGNDDHEVNFTAKSATMWTTADTNIFNITELEVF